jgi:NitT/TauT family transport system substrate-binding protein
MGAILYNKTEGQVVCVSPVTKGVLYIVQNGGARITSFADLNGREILAAAKGSTPEFILNRLMEENGIDPEAAKVRWMANHTDVSSTLLAGEGTIAMLPEPFVTVALKKGSGAAVAFDLNEEWLKATGYPLSMSVLVVQKSFADGRKDALAGFLKDYKTSVDFINGNTEDAAALLSEKGFIADKDVAREAIPRCNIVFYEDAAESRAMLDSLYAVLYETDPKSVGGRLPDAEFYYQE